MQDNTGNAANTETRRLAAIMFTDIVGFSRQMGSNEARSLRLLDTHNQAIHQAVTEQLHVRIGIHLGDIVQKAGDVFGDGVNIAARLQALAAPDTICISHVVYQEVVQKLALGTVVSLGQPKLKNITQRQPVYTLLS